ncbi:PTS lactose/cellobiose transporter subunit IIA [Clostridium intestinale]|uniref:PTS lactose/cellobiose transporter subunit IIA n=1 Tax=Clostridium intestinale TaxID=36845 RepID=UPI002DD6917C|nr:PTS lactose/cellobiose transporter subunit IIA [Clostridium intestinale]WRY51488.1 PTS lactose/cellobiose transporter subunit IIA [Clostridium intestinale]
MENLEMIACEIISNVGTAKSLIMEGLAEAREGNFHETKMKLKEADEYFKNGHKSHLELLQQDALGNKIEISMILLHTEDQLMSAETIKCLANEMIEMYRLQHELKEERVKNG